MSGIVSSFTVVNQSLHSPRMRNRSCKQLDAMSSIEKTEDHYMDKVKTQIKVNTLQLVLIFLSFTCIVHTDDKLEHFAMKGELVSPLGLCKG